MGFITVCTGAAIDGGPVLIGLLAGFATLWTIIIAACKINAARYRKWRPLQAYVVKKEAVLNVPTEVCRSKYIMRYTDEAGDRYEIEHQQNERDGVKNAGGWNEGETVDVLVSPAGDKLARRTAPVKVPRGMFIPGIAVYAMAAWMWLAMYKPEFLLSAEVLHGAALALAGLLFGGIGVKLTLFNIRTEKSVTVDEDGTRRVKCKRKPDIGVSFFIGLFCLLVSGVLIVSIFTPV